MAKQAVNKKNLIVLAAVLAVVIFLGGAKSFAIGSSSFCRDMSHNVQKSRADIFVAAAPKSHTFCVDYIDARGEYIKTAHYRHLFLGLSRNGVDRLILSYSKKGLDICGTAAQIFDGLAADIKEFEKLYFVPSCDAVAKFKPYKKDKFEYIPDVDGKTVDKARLCQDLINNIDKPRATIVLKDKTVPADRTLAKLKAVTRYRAGFSTGYSTSKYNRKHNIALAARYINGTVLADGDVFSFNEVVGKRRAERGFMSAPIMLGGKLVEGVGGGVCQVSTTCYNAALFADLDIVHATQHSALVSYVKPSFDAMVSSQNDLQFKNNTGYPIYIAATADGKTIKIEMYGNPLDKGLEIKQRSQTIRYIPKRDRIIENDGTYKIPDDADTHHRVFDGWDGCESHGYIDYYRNGKLIRSKFIRKDIYQPMSGVLVRVGDVAQRERGGVLQ